MQTEVICLCLGPTPLSPKIRPLDEFLNQNVNARNDTVKSTGADIFQVRGAMSLSLGVPDGDQANGG